MRDLSCDKYKEVIENINKSLDNLDELRKTIDKVIKNKIKEEHLQNYFKYLFIQARDYINKNN